MDSTQSDERFYTGPAHWRVAPAREGLEAEGFTVVEWPWLCERWVAPTRKMDMRRPSLLSAAHEWLAWMTEVDKLAVIDVSTDDADAVADLLGFVVEPAARLGIELVIGHEVELEQLDPARLVEPYFGYPYSFERLQWCLAGGRPATATTRLLNETGFVPDATQERAVRAGEGVVQIIAPAGSGKTAVLVERVRELLRRGAPPEAIVCLTFNKAAAKELQERLAAAGVGEVNARTFHSLGLQILRSANALPRDKELWSPSLGQWRKLAFDAKRSVGEDGYWLESPEAKSEISNIKLGRMMTAQQYAQTLDEKSDARARTVAALYTGYEELQRQSGRRIDFDDMILRAVQRLREDSSVRGRWQSTYQYVLVDEYQDIEPAQELLVRLVAAPQDQLFCVGDEDQTLYAFRRASVERIILLDNLYPALERVALGVNYRCPPAVVKASRALIEHNKVRFSKQIAAGQPDAEGRAILARGFASKPESAVVVAQTLKDKARGEIVVLARTTDALRPVALACADMGVKIDGPQKLFEPTGARKALEDHLRLVLAPQDADEKLIRNVCRTPGRSVSPEDRVPIATRLQGGESFGAAFAGIDAPRRGDGKLLSPGELFTQLAQCEDAGEAVALLRGPGGLDEWFENEDQMGGLDQFDCDALEQAEQNAKGMSPRDYLDELKGQTQRLKTCRDTKEGIELSTIHGAKGRQWPHVIVVACDEKMLPHKRALEGLTNEDRARGDGIEAERRLGYVAFTRAQKRLEIHYEVERPSIFLYESGILERLVKPARSPRKPPPAPGLSPKPKKNKKKTQKQGISIRAMLKQLGSADRPE
ncbi:MAG TPA: ATP-dependent helicase [Solirubrobacteraceae bacterium]|jgi:DNA helicase-2/ATP-dependent DNA helicase PcrA|nr:ATP-dependent helicase [Solirubrobacteraceae bacterium]